MSELKEEIRALRESMEENAGAEAFVSAVFAALRAHREELAGLNLSCRLTVTDAQAGYAFQLEEGAFSPLGEEDPVDVTLSGREKDLLGVASGRINAAGALLLGKVKVTGSLAKLLAFAPYL